MRLRTIGSSATQNENTESRVVSRRQELHFTQTPRCVSSCTDYSESDAVTSQRLVKGDLRFLVDKGCTHPYNCVDEQSEVSLFPGVDDHCG